MTTLDPAHIAEELAAKYNPDGIAPFPFDAIQDDFDDLGIFVTDKLEPNVSGLILYEKEDDQFHILINADKPVRRQYFSTAHELGHYFLHKEIVKQQEFIIDGDETLDRIGMLMRLDDITLTKLEREANTFAASLLMPELLVTKAWQTLADVQSCADLFQVSLSAMSIRLEKMHLTDHGA